MESEADTLTQAPRPDFERDRLTRAEAAQFLGLAESTLETDATTHRLKIPFYKLGPRKVYYRRSDLQDWLEGRRVDQACQSGVTPRAIPVEDEQ